MAPKYMTFQKLVEALDKPVLISYPLHESDFSYQLGHKPVAQLQKTVSGKYHQYAAQVGPSLFAEYCTKHPIAINLWHAYRGAAWEFASVYAMPEGRTLYRYWNLAVSKQDAQWQRKVDLERWCCGTLQYTGSLPKTLRSRLPAITRRSISGPLSLLDEDGTQLDADVRYVDRLFALPSHSTAHHCARSPCLPSHDWWRPARIARSYAATLRRDLSPMGDFFVRAHNQYRQHNTRESGWNAGVYVWNAAGECGPPLWVHDSSKVEQLAEQKDGILSWAANNVYIPGPSI